MTKTSGGKLVDMTIRDWIEERAITHGNAPALQDISGSTQLSFAELAERISELARAFQELGIGRNSRVAVCLTDGPESLTILLSLMSITAVLPIHPAAAVAPIDALVDKLGISVVVGGQRPASAAWKVAEERQLTYVEIESNPSQIGDVRLKPHRPVTVPSHDTAGLDDVALYITTSGTTGKATVVAITQRSLDRNIATHGTLNGYGPGTRAICVMSFTYLFAYVRASLPMLRLGGTVAVAPGYRFPDIQRCCDTFRPTCMAATPTILRKFIADSEIRRWRPAHGVLRSFHATGEAIPKFLRERLRDVFGASLGTNYGMTEVSPQVTVCRPEDHFEPGAAGRIVPPWLVDAVDDDGTVLAAGQVGRIALRGGHINAIVGIEKETRFDATGRFLTGDRGFVDKAGVLFLVGRADEVINRGGEKIDPKTIEQSIETDPDVVHAVAFGLPDPQLGQKIFALIVLRAGASRGVQQIRESAGTRLTGWGMPEQIFVVTKIPTNANEKVSRRDLAIRYSDD